MAEAAAIVGPSVWRGDEMERSKRWLREWPPHVVAELEDAVDGARRLDRRELTALNFPLARSAAFLAEVAQELEHGCGMVLLRGLPVARFGEEDLRKLWFGLGVNLGRPVFQNRSGELMRAIRDEGAGIGRRYGQVETEGRPFLSSYARTLSNGQLRFHTDRCDAVGLLCVRQARSGGLSKLASSPAVHNAMLERRTDLAEALYRDVWRSRFGEEAGGERMAYPLPVFGQRDGRFTSHFSLTYIEAAQLMASTPRLSAAQREAIDVLLATAEELSFGMTLEPGDIQLLNNHTIYHGRTPFEDDAAGGRDRLLLRLWLSMPNSRALPVGHEVLWGNVAAGALRGGIGQETA